MRKALVVQRIVGAIYVIAGVAKFFPGLEDVGEVLRRSAEANAGTAVAGISEAVAARPQAVQIFVAVAMLASGLVQVLDRGPVRAACVGQMLMLVCFSAIIGRFNPAVVPVDVAFFAAALYIALRRSNAPTREDAPAA